jgi:hypothetical protein
MLAPTIVRPGWFSGFLVFRLAIRRPDSDASRFDRHDGTLRKLLPIPGECCRRDSTVIFGATVHEPDDADVRSLQDDGELAEVFVDRDQDLGGFEGVFEDFVVAGIARPGCG